MKRFLAILLAALLMLALASCGTAEKEAEKPEDGKQNETIDGGEKTPEPEKDVLAQGDKLRVAGLKGPTSIGMLKFISDRKDVVEYTLAGAADELTAPFIQGSLDVVAVPCNLASVLYNKTEGNVQVLAVNTLGVLYVLDTTGEIASVADLKGKTVYSTGKGTTPEYVLDYILEKNGLEVGKDVTVEFVSEATEAAALLSSGGASVAVLPQPYVTSVLAQNENVKVALSLTEEWKKVSGGTELITGVVIAKKDFVENNKEKIDAFLSEYEESIKFANDNVEETAKLCVEYEVIAKEAIAAKAIPACNIAFMSGAEMKAAVSAYLAVLFEAAPASVGGALPADGFYYGT